MENRNDLEHVVPDEVVEIIRPARKSGSVFLFIILIIALLIVGVFIVPFCCGAQNTGDGLGSMTGSAVGLAVGSFEGITSGIAEGAKAGKEEGLSAKDTEVAVANEMANVGKLDVLEAEDQFVNDYREGSDYKALFVYKAKATFSVNLDEADIQKTEAGVLILLPDVECEFIIDENESQKLAEWQKYFWSGSTEDGYIGYMNSMAQIKEKAADEMTNYDYLMDQARSSAKKQVQILAESVTAGENVLVEVEFKEEVE